MFYLCPCKAGSFFIWGLKNLSVWSSVLFTVSTLEMRETEALENRQDQRVSPSRQVLRFIAWLIYAVFTVDCLMIICK